MLTKRVEDQINADCEAWNLENVVSEVAKSYIRQIESDQDFQTTPWKLISAGCILVASGQSDFPRSLGEISEASGIPRAELARQYTSLAKALPMVQTVEDPSMEEEMTFSYLSELGRFFGDTAPITISFTFQNLVQAFSIFTCGRLGTFELSVASFGYMFFSATAAMVALGGSTAVDTLCAQAFTSRHTAGKKDYLGIVMQRGLLFLTVFFFALMAPIWWNSGRIFRQLGQEADFADTTEVFLKYMLPAGFAQVIAEVFKKFLQVQNHRTAVGWCIGIAAVIGVVANHVLVLKTPLGINGAPLAHAVYQGSTIVAMAVFVSSNKSAKAYWGGFSRRAFEDFGTFVFLAITGMLTVATEFWCFESIALMAATLDSASVGAQSIIMTSDLVFATIPLGLSVSSSHRIGKSLGAGDGRFARFQARMPYLVALIVGLFECVILLSIRNVYGYIFTRDVDVVEITAKVLFILAVFQCLDISNSGAAGILRGVAKTHLAGACNVFGYYCFGLPLAWYFCFRLELGLFGLWSGLVCGAAALLLLQTGLILAIDWEKEADAVVAKAAERAAGERAPLLEDADQALLTSRL